MRKLSSIILFSFLLLIAFEGCSSRKDETKEKAFLSYVLSCGPGGTVDSCNAGCASTYGAPTAENFQALNACTSACSSNCNLLTLFLQFSSYNK
ncbi:hypothetical protein AB3N59_08290 [Leptospira sp. WS92.C1]